jgi:type VI secretion system protein ImpM
MRCGLFGKLPTKRDFVAVSAPREFLGIWEKWMQGGISGSRNRLGPAWQEAFLTAPIWRFWLGREICGMTTLGAFMPSVDGVGRYFPLTVFACAADDAAIAPPEMDPQNAWFEAAESLLLSSLDEETTFEGLLSALDLLHPPASEASRREPDEMIRLQDGTIVLAAPPESLPEALASVRAADFGRAYGNDSFWWTLGGEAFRPLALVARRMPDPFLMAGMLTGSFGAGPGRL